MRHRIPTAVFCLLMFPPAAVRGQNAAPAQESGRRPEESRCGAAAPLSEPIRVGSNVQKSKLRTSIQPVYPPDARGAGRILLQVTINEAGAVYSVHFLRCRAPLREAVLAAVCKWRYEPTYLHARPVSVMAIVELPYNLARYRL